MSDLMRYAAELDGAGAKQLPPVDAWTPAYCGELDLVIRADGVWVHEGTPIGRARLVRLFSTILRREGDLYFLVTPAEKLGIRVEDAPFVAVLLRVEGDGEEQRLTFTTNVGDEIVAGPARPLTLANTSREGETAPYIEVRAGLKARVARAVYYDLVALGETRETVGGRVFGVWSGGVFHAFGPAFETGGA